MAQRSDSIGMFWVDEAKVKPLPKAKIKRSPPDPVWERADYLPNLAEAQALELDLFNDMDLWQASINKEHLLYDIECYPNYVLFAFRSVESKKCVYFELSTLWPRAAQLAIPKLLWVIQNFCLINFNGRKYDFPISALAVAGKSAAQMWDATAMLIQEGLQSQEVLKLFKVKKIMDINQIDLIELTALGPGLKVCAGRLHAQRLQDLPFKPGTMLSPDQAIIVRWYCFNDLDNTELLYHALEEPLQIRIDTGKKYNLDLRSHSDAQMAEAIINSEIKKRTGAKHIHRTKIVGGTTYKFKTPKFIKFQSPLLNYALDVIQSSVFTVSFDDGSLKMPPQLEDLTITMNKSTYQFGIGGLHSQEKSVAHYSDENYILRDIDATSYYPFLILNAGIAPANLGKDFLVVYNGIVVDRVNAKKAGEIIVAECLKIVVNGTFGKLGSMWSIMYAPDLMLQVTMTGQLSIVMLAERFELAGIEVTSINTDGIVTKCHRSKEAEFNAIVKQWEKDTGFATEETRYKATFSRDINNYFAIYETPQKGKLFKAKGAYGPTAPKKNAVTEICSNAAIEYLIHGTPINHTIRNCRDITKFTSMRAVRGGAVKDGIFLGKLIRWYYSAGETSEIIYALTGNKVARTDGAKPLMNLPKEFPEDVNYEWYETEAYRILEDIGHTPKTVKSPKTKLPPAAKAVTI